MYLEVGFLQRKVGNSMTPTVEITLNVDEYTLTTSSMVFIISVCVINDMYQ